MALAAVHYKYFNVLKDQNRLPKAPSILEIGEQNWYGDLDPHVLLHDIRKYSPEASRIRLQEFVKSAIGNPSKKRLFDFVKVFYEIYFESKKIRSIDMHGTKFAERLDLNLPHDLGEQFDAIINLGTAEHIFNVYQVFKSMHDWLKVGGRMYHNLPMYGEIDHGFYNFHPTLFWDLAFANQYKIIAIAKASAKSLTFAQSRVSLSKDISMQDKSKTYGLFVTLEKSIDKPFEIPQQGRYDDTLSDQAQITAEWKRQRKVSDES